MINKPDFAKFFVGLAFAGMSLLGSAIEANELEGSRPNITLVMTDDQGIYRFLTSSPQVGR